MALTNQQIDRYSRQIIVSGMGGLGQERLLGSRLMLAGSTGAIEPALAYMVGAGVGAIRLRTSGRDSAAPKRLADRMRGLNSDVAVDCFAGESHDLSLDDLSLIMVLATNAEDLGIVRGPRNQSNTPLLFARLDTSARIAIFPSYPPCPVCAEADLLAPLADRAEIADFVAMAAATLALKTLASGRAIVPAPTLIEFSGYRTISRPISARPNAECSCGMRGIS